MSWNHKTHDKETFRLNETSKDELERRKTIYRMQAKELLNNGFLTLVLEKMKETWTMLNDATAFDEDSKRLEYTLRKQSIIDLQRELLKIARKEDPVEEMEATTKKYFH